MDYFLNMIGILSGGLGTTLGIFALTLIFSVPLGIIVAFLKMSNVKIISYITNIYILIVRGTPLMLQLIFFYFAPYLIFGASSPNRFTATIFAFSINYAAYFAEIFRGGIQSIPKGQGEAAQILGLTKGQAFFHITLPQVLKNILPASANEVITLIKDTSLAHVIAVSELFTLAQKQAVTTIYPIFIAGIFYFVLNGILTVFFSKLEKKLDYYK